MYESSSESDALASPKSDTFVLNNTRTHGRSVSTSINKLPDNFPEASKSYNPPRRRMSSDAPDYTSHGSSMRAKSVGAPRPPTKKKSSNFDEKEYDSTEPSMSVSQRKRKGKKKKKGRRKHHSKRSNTSKSRMSSFDNLELQFPYPKEQVTKDDLVKLMVKMLFHDTPLTVMDRRASWHMRSYKKCFVGSEFVDWTVKYQKKTRKEGIEIGAKMVQENVFRHVAGRESFEDGFFFYKFTAEAIQEFPAQLQMELLKRKRSISRFFKKVPRMKMRVLLLGLDSAGKTTIMYRLKFGKIPNTVPTIGFNVETIKHKKVEINLWDVGGQDRLRPQWRHHYQGTSGVIFVIDSNDTARIGKAREELHFLMQEEELGQACICVLANKQDLPHALDSGQLEEQLELNLLPHDHRIFPTNAKTGKGLEEALDWLCMYMKPF